MGPAASISGRRPRPERWAGGPLIRGVAWVALLLPAMLSGCSAGEPRTDRPSESGVPSPGDDLADENPAASLPYLNAVPDRDAGRKGMVLHVKEKAWPGVNLYTPRTIPEARLIDMEGRLVHRWSSDAAQPRPRDAAIMDFLLGWHHVEPIGGGRIVAVVENKALLALDRDSNLIWRTDLGAHHDVGRSPSGTLYTVAARIRPHQSGDGILPILDDDIVVLSGEGEVLRSLSIMDLLADDPRTSAVFRRYVQARMDAYTPERTRAYVDGLRRIHARLGPENVEAHVKLFEEVLAGTYEGRPELALSVLRNSPSDVLHANSVEYLSEHPAGFWREGDLLISIRNADMLAIVDMQGDRLRWVWGPGTLDQQHQPGATSRGTILVFDNGPRERRSRILEIDTAGNTILWSYEGSPPSRFFSPIRGGCEELPNGNILIAESERGRVFEITRGKEMVWEFFSTEVHRNGRQRAPIYRMARVDPGWVLPPEGNP